MKYIAIDQSYTSSGIIIFEDEEIIHAERFPSTKSNTIFARASQIANHILNLAKQYQPDFIVLEGLAFGMRGNATRDLAGLQFVIIVLLQELNGFSVDIIAPLTVKKFATGKGKAKKQDMLEAVPQKTKEFLVEKLGLKKTKGLYDVVDAYFIGLYAYSVKKTNNT